MPRPRSLPAAFRRHLVTLDLGPTPVRLIAAVSGGPDSVALLDLLAGVSGELALELVVAHVDHGIHPESARVAEMVRALADRYGLAFAMRTLALGAEASETTARAARYEALEAMRAEAGAVFIVTAHHADDQAETVLMRVLGGTGPAGLAGMAARRGTILRPLLPFSRNELARHVQSAGAHLWEDPSNQHPRHLRAWLRTEILPALERRLPDVPRRLNRVAAGAAADRAGWNELLDLLPGLEVRTGRSGVSCALEPLEVCGNNLAECLILALARRAGILLGPKRAKRVLALVRLGESGTWVPLGGEWKAERAFGRLLLGRLQLGRAQTPPFEAQRLSGQMGAARWGDWRFTWTHDTAPPRQERSASNAWFRAGDRGLDALVVRPWRPGERLHPLGGAGHRLLVRCFQDARVPRSERAGWPVVEHEGAIVWLPGICRSAGLVPAPGDEALHVEAVRGAGTRDDAEPA